MIGHNVNCFAILELVLVLSYLLRLADSLWRIPWKATIRFFPRNKADIFWLIAPVLNIVQHQRMTRLGGPTISQSSSKFFSLLRDEIIGVFGFSFLYCATYCSVIGNSNVVSPKIWRIFFPGPSSARLQRSATTVESFPPLNETNISPISIPCVSSQM